MRSLRLAFVVTLLACPAIGHAIPSITVAPTVAASGQTGVAIDLFFNVFPGDLVTAGRSALESSGGTTFTSALGVNVAGVGTIGGINDPNQVVFVFGPNCGNSNCLLAVGAHQFASLTLDTGAPGDDVVLRAGTWIQAPFCGALVSNSGATLVEVVSADRDGDGVVDGLDNCPDVPNPGQEDADENGVGDACNALEDRDGDEFSDALDNCPNDFNPSQSDRDDDGLGDDCDPFPDAPNNALQQCRLDLANCRIGNPGTDADADGEVDATDRCPTTPSGASVDHSGCSQEEFCGRITFGNRVGRAMAECNAADWKNDERLGDPLDCRVHMLERGRLLCASR